MATLKLKNNFFKEYNEIKEENKINVSESIDDIQKQIEDGNKFIQVEVCRMYELFGIWREGKKRESFHVNNIVAITE